MGQRMYLNYRFFAVAVFTLLAGYTHAQVTAQGAFGKNRVQYNKQIDKWMYYESEHFVTYWYGDARNVAQAALQTGEYDYNALHHLLEHQGTDKFEMLVFSDLTDLKQSNIGTEEIFQLRAGETKVVDNKIFVFFDGNHQHLRTQIRQGIAEVLINSMLFGSNLQEIVQNAVMLNLPGWYTNGLAAYCGERWSTTHDETLRNLILSGDFETFEGLAKLHPQLTGHAFWYYISLHYGSNTVSNLLYLTRINRSVDAGFLYVLGSGYTRTTDAMMQYFEKRYRNESSSTVVPETEGHLKVRNKKQIPLSHVRLSPDGKRLAWTRNDLGKWKVYVQELSTGKTRRVLKGGLRNAQQTTDFNYPILAWNPDNRRLTVLYERRDVARLAILEPEKRKSKTDDILSPEYQRVYSMDFINPVDMVLSAAVRGYSDLFIYNTVNRQTRRITHDFWDDLDAVSVNLDGRPGILFSSNRVDDTLSVQQRIDSLLPLGRFDLFYFDLQEGNQELVRITHTPLVDERSPAALDSTHFLFISDLSGIGNRHAGYLEPYIAYYQDVIYLNDGAAVKALNTRQQGEWTQERALALLAPTDSVLVNIDSTAIDSITTAAVYKKKTVTWNQTNYRYSIQELHVSPASGTQVMRFRVNAADSFLIAPAEPATKSKPRYTRFRELDLAENNLPIPLFTQKDNPADESDQQNAKQDTLSGITLRTNSDTLRPGWLFRVPEVLQGAPPPKTEADVYEQPEDEAPANEKLLASNDTPKQTGGHTDIRHKANTRFNTAQIVPYRLRFRTDFISTTIDNNLLFDGLESYAATPSDFQTPPPGLLIRANMKDLLENYVLEAGFRLPTTFNGAEYYLTFDDKKRRWDKRYALYRKTTVNNVNDESAPPQLEPSQVRTNTVLGQFELRYPVNVFFSLRGRFTLRQDKAIFLSTNRVNLEVPDYAEQRAAARLSAVFDNTVNVELNIRHGTRAMVFVEAVKRFAFNTQPTWQLDFNEGFMTVIGLDARHYVRLDRKSILALRAAGTTSFGSERILYYLGGIENWMFPRFNQNIPVPPLGEDFAYQTLAANMRGFEQNIRNGNSYALVNAELRVPIFKYISKSPVLGNFWRNFQLVGFFDAGTAWEGNDPYSGENPLNTVVVENPPTVTVRVNYFRDPIVAGYGFGARALIFGIHVRADYAWGIETRVVQKPIFYLGLGVDF